MRMREAAGYAMLLFEPLLHLTLTLQTEWCYFCGGAIEDDHYEHEHSCPMYMEDHPLLLGESPDAQALFHYYRALRMLHEVKLRSDPQLFDAAFAACPAAFFTDFASEPATDETAAVRGRTITLADVNTDPESRRPLLTDPSTQLTRPYAGHMP